MSVRKGKEFSEQLESVTPSTLYEHFSSGSDAHKRRKWWHNGAFCKVLSVPRRPSHPSNRIHRTAVNFTFSRSSNLFFRPSNPPALRMRSGLHRSGSLTSPHLMVRQLFRFVIRPRRDGVRNVWVERFPRSCDGREH